MSIITVIALPIKWTICSHLSYTGFRVSGNIKKPIPSNDRAPKKQATKTFCRHAAIVHKSPKKKRATVPNFRISFLSVEDKVIFPLFSLFPRRLFFFIKDTVFHYKNVHLGPHKTFISIFRRADNRFPTHIEASIH